MRSKHIVVGFYADGTPILLPMGADDFDANMDGGEDGDDGNEDDNEDDDDEDGDEDVTKENSKSDEKKSKPLSPQETEIAELRRKLAKTRGESARRRKQIATLQSEIDASKDNSEEAKSAREAEARGFKDAEDKYRPKIINLAGRNALLAAGVPASKVRRALKLIEMDDVEIDDDGEVIGIEDAVDELKEDWPELFAAKSEEKEENPRGNRSSAPKVKSSDVNGAGRKGSAPKKLNADEELLRRLTGISPS